MIGWGLWSQYIICSSWVWPSDFRGWLCYNKRQYVFVPQLLPGADFALWPNLGEELDFIHLFATWSTYRSTPNWPEHFKLDECVILANLQVGYNKGSLPLDRSIWAACMVRIVTRATFSSTQFLHSPGPVKLEQGGWETYFPFRTEYNLDGSTRFVYPSYQDSE